MGCLNFFSSGQKLMCLDCVHIRLSDVCTSYSNIPTVCHGWVCRDRVFGVIRAFLQVIAGKAKKDDLRDVLTMVRTTDNPQVSARTEAREKKTVDFFQGGAVRSR